MVSMMRGVHSRMLASAISSLESRSRWVSRSAGVQRMGPVEWRSSASSTHMAAG